MIQDYFKTITVYTRTQSDDEFGGKTTEYSEEGTVEGILQRTATSESLKAEQLQNSDSYIFMYIPGDLIVNPDDIITDGEITARVVSETIHCPNANSMMAKIYQHTCEKYSMEVNQ